MCVCVCETFVMSVSVRVCVCVWLKKRCCTWRHFCHGKNTQQTQIILTGENYLSKIIENKSPKALNHQGSYIHWSAIKSFLISYKFTVYYLSNYKYYKNSFTEKDYVFIHLIKDFLFILKSYSQLIIILNCFIKMELRFKEILKLIGP
jgi:hypothetical protein